jgi:hypothetical protein
MFLGKKSWVTSWSQLGHSWVTAGSQLDRSWVTAGSQLGHSWISAGSQLDHSWVIAGLGQLLSLSRRRLKRQLKRYHCAL